MTTTAALTDAENARWDAIRAKEQRDTSKWLKLHGWQRSRRDLCVELLLDPLHNCNRCVGPYSEAHARLHLDHALLLRQPIRWAILSQDYAEENHDDRAADLGLAPYGAGTRANLYVGRTAQREVVHMCTGCGRPILPKAEHYLDSADQVWHSRCFQRPYSDPGARWFSTRRQLDRDRTGLDDVLRGTAAGYLVEVTR